MTNKTFTANIYPFKVFSAFFALSSIFFILTLGNHVSAYLLAFLGIGLAVICWSVPPPKIEINDKSIIRQQYGSPGSGILSRLVLPDTECKWNWIDAVSTTRLNSGSFLTALYFSEKLPNKPKYRVTIESALFKDYVSILRIIKERASQAHFDKTTESIVNGQIDIRSVRPLYGGLFIVIIVSAFLFIYIMGKV